MGFGDYATKRESSRDALSALYDTPSRYAQELQEGVRQRIRTFSQDMPSDVYYAVRLLSGIRGAGIVVHGPRGCCAFAPHFRIRAGSAPISVTNLSEQNTILGGEHQLRETLTEYIRHFGLSLIFVVTTPPVSINSDDTGAVIAEITEEFGVTVIGVLTTGFQSRLGVTGYDSALLPVFNRLADRIDDRTEPFVNLISVSEHPEDAAEAARLLNLLGLSVNTLPNTGGAAAFRRAGAAEASIVLNSGEGLLLAEKLEEAFGVPFFAPPLPLGPVGAQDFLAQTARFLGREFEGASAPSGIPALRGRNIFIQASPVYAAALIRLVRNSGGTVAGVGTPFLDRVVLPLFEGYDEKLLVGEYQGFELENLLDETKVDLFLSETGAVEPAFRRGIPAVVFGETALLSPSGWEQLHRRVGSALKNGAFARSLKTDSPEPYTESWLNRRVNWYIKQEVV